MKVLHILNTGKYSGAENVVITLINAGKKRVDCAYASPEGPISDILYENGITYFPIRTDKVSLKEVRHIINEYKPDIIHAHDFTASVVTAATMTHVPIVSHLHNNVPWLGKFCIRSIVYGASSIRYRKVLTVSKSVSEEYIFGKALKKKFIIVGNPISIEAINDKAYHSKLKQPSDIIFLGRLSKEKNPIFFLELIKDLVSEKPDLTVSIVGSGELEDSVKKKCKELNLEKNVHMYGFQKNPYGLLMNSKLLCMPSLWEGFGLAAVEALTLGVPVVAAPVGGLVEIVNDGCGKLCINKNEYLNEIRKLLSDSLYYEVKSKNAYERARELDNLGKYINSLINIYEDAIL